MMEAVLIVFGIVVVLIMLQITEVYRTLESINRNTSIMIRQNERLIDAFEDEYYYDDTEEIEDN